MTLDEVRIVWEKVAKYRKEAFPDRWIDWMDSYCGTRVDIHYKQYFVAVHFFNLGDDNWDLSAKVYFADVRYALQEVGFQMADLKDTDALMKFIDNCLERMVKMPDTIKLIKDKWAELWSK